MTGLPWFKFFWGEFQTTERIASCSPEARFLLIAMYGFLKYNGEKRFVFDPKFIEKRFDFSQKSAKKCTEELQKAGLICIDSEGFVSVPELFKSSHISEVRSVAGKKGGKNHSSFAPKQNTGQSPSDSDSVFSSSSSSLLTESVFSSSSSSLLTERGVRGENMTDTAALPEDCPEQVPESNAAPPRAKRKGGAVEPLPRRKKAREESLSAFETWYCTVYPRREGREDAEKAWVQVTVNAPAHKRASPEEILEGTRQQIAAGVFNRERRFIQLPAGYLRGYRFRDDVPAHGAGAAPAFAFQTGVAPVLHEFDFDEETR